MGATKWCATTVPVFVRKYVKSSFQMGGLGEDLTRLDVFLRGHLNSIVYKNRSHNIDIIECIRIEIAK